MSYIINYVNDNLPEYGFVANTYATYQGDWCPYDTMPVTPDP